MSESEDFSRFWDDAGAAADRFGASLDGPECEAFVRELYSDFLNVQPKAKKKWLNDVVSVSFKCLKVRPKWSGEPSWPFIDGNPMIFLNQFTIPLSAQHIDFPLTDTVFVFAAKSVQPDGSARMVFKLILQSEEGYTINPKVGDSMEF